MSIGNDDSKFSGKQKVNVKKSLKIADGGKSEWIGDGFCDDMNNQELCDYDHGDCCGAFKRINFCMKCECIRKLRYVM